MIFSNRESRWEGRGREGRESEMVVVVVIVVFCLYLTHD